MENLCKMLLWVWPKGSLMTLLHFLLLLEEATSQKEQFLLLPNFFCPCNNKRSTKDEIDNPIQCDYAATIISTDHRIIIRNLKSD